MVACRFSFFILLLCLLNIRSSEARDRDSLNLDALENLPGVDFKIIALGGHEAFCVQLNVNNQTNDTIVVYVEPGRLLLCENADMQDLIVMRSIHCKIAPYMTIVKPLYAFCCRARRASPAKGIAFRNGYVEISHLGKLARFVDKGNYPVADVQSSVWTISDNYPLASICDRSGNQSPLKKWLAQQLNKPYPWHCIEYDKRDTSVMNIKHIRVNGTISFFVPHYSTVTIQVRSLDGRIIDFLQRDAVYAGGELNFPIDINVQNWPKGIYEILVFADGNRINKPTFFDL